MMSSIREWLHLAVRWFHVFAGIMWVGQTYYFTWLDGQFSKLEEKAAADGTAPALWMVHSGGFYAVEKQRSLQVGPELVHWFRWEAMMTWLSGILLLFLLYYFGGGLIDTDVADISLVRTNFEALCQDIKRYADHDPHRDSQQRGRSQGARSEPA